MNENEISYEFLNSSNNLFYFRFVIFMNKISNIMPLNSFELIGSIYGGIVYMLECNSTIYDIEYDFVNGIIIRFNTNKSNNSITNIFKSILNAIIINTNYFR